MATTLREVALRAGVSISTASRALSHPELVEGSTRRRVLAAASDLRYAPNQAGRALSTGRTGAWGMVVPDLRNPFFPGIVKAAQSAAHEAGQSLLIVDTDENPEAEFERVHSLARQTDAIILCSSRMTDDELQRAAALSSLVLISRAHPALPSVTFDTSAGVREAAEHLRALGHRRVGYAAGPSHSFSDQERAASVVTEFEAQGMEVIHLGNFDPSPEGGRKAADRALLANVTAVIAYDDIMAMGLIGRLQAYGVRVPEQMSIIGWDDIEFSEMFTPSLTTIHLPRERAGEAAVDVLQRAADGAELPSMRLDTHLVFRQTTAPVSSGFEGASA